MVSNSPHTDMQVAVYLILRLFAMPCFLYADNMVYSLYLQQDHMYKLSIGGFPMENMDSILEKPKWIGVCMSQAHTFLKEELLCELDRAARKEGYGLLVFNSSMDWYWSRRGGNVTGCVYDMIRYDLLCALVILHENIYDPGQLERMIRCTEARKIPVLYLGGRHPLCISITDDYTETYKNLVRHVVREHHARDCFYIAGLEDEDNSRLRLKCWQEVMQEFGLPCGEEYYAFGDFLDTVAVQVVRTLREKRAGMPRAIFCANDSMAAGVCEYLIREGIRVPEDVIVTGFDGTPASYLIQPQLTTCDSNLAALARQVMEVILSYNPDDPKVGSAAQPVLTHRYSTVFTESCGCPAVVHERYNVLHTLRQAEMLFTHENTTYYAVDRLLDEKEMYPFLARLGELLLPDSALYLNRSLLETSPDTENMPDHPEDELIMIPHCEPNEAPSLRKVYLRDMPVPSSASSGVTILNIVHSDTRVCGYYAAHTDDLATDAQLIKRLSDVLNMVSSIQLGRIRQQQLVARLENNLYMDSIAGLSNLKGLTRWYEQFTAQEAFRHRVLSVSVYSLPRYSWIYETYGMAETEDVIRIVTRALIDANPEAMHIARISEDMFAVIDAPENESALSALIVRNSNAFFRQIEKYNSGTSKPYFLEVSSGVTHLDRNWQPVPLENLISMATGEMYLNRLRTAETEDAPHADGNAAARASAFNLLMEKNLFRFHFQPIVDARSGMIYAYEALMRTDSIINLTPLEILKTAREQGRLYDVEHATVFGIMERYVRSYKDFQGSKVFINTIPGYFLSEEDCNALIGKYESFLDCFVFELTEDNPTSDAELDRLKRICKPGAQTQIAIDDFGTGHSNILNLLRYTPQIIKIDRGLVSGIATDANRRLFVRNTIEFAHQNGIRALAEGVETSEELRAVIDCGIDLIQGFYTGRPAEVPVRSVSDKVVREIREENMHVAQGAREVLFYEPKDGETIDLLDLSLRKYSCILLDQGSYTLKGEKSHSVDIIVRTRDNTSVSLVLDQVNLTGSTEPCIRLGNHAELLLEAVGQNTLNRDGIGVPPTSKLTLRGKGNLMVHNTRNYSIGIGANYNDPYGTIILETEGVLLVRTSGDRAVCIGGGVSAGGGIRIHGGVLDLHSSGVSVVCIGSSSGDADIEITGTRVNIHAEGNDALLIGSVSGSAEIRLSGEYRLFSACERTTAVGTMNGTADVVFAGGSVNADIHCDSGAILGTFSGEAKVIYRDTTVRIHGEGNRIAGFGSLNGACDTRVESGEISGDLLAAERFLIGNKHSRFMVTGGNFRLFPEDGSVPVSPCGAPLHFLNPEGDHFEQAFTDRRASWTYKADRNGDGWLGVWIP